MKTISGHPQSPSLAPAVFALWFAFLFIVSQWPLYLVRYVNIGDFVNHAARLHIMLQLDSDPLLRRHYEWTVAVAPNLPIDTLGLLLVKLFGVETGFKLFASLCTLVLTSGSVAFGRILSGRFDPLLLGSVLFANNFCLYYGIFNYVFGIGLALWLLAGWLASRRRSPSYRLAVFAFGTSLLYLCHLSALGVYAAGIGCVLLAECWRDRKTQRLPEWRLAGLQFVPAAVMHLWFYHPPARDFIPLAPFGIKAIVLRKLMLIVEMPTLLLRYPNPIYLLDVLVGVAVFLGLYFAVRLRIFSLSPLAASIAATLLALMLVLPDRAFGSCFVDGRLLLPIGLFLWSGLACAAGKPARWRTFAPVAIALCVGLISFKHFTFNQAVEAEQAGLRAALRQVRPGAKIATVMLPDSSHDISEQSAGWATIDRSALISSLYTRPFQPVFIGMTAEAARDARLARFDDPYAPATPLKVLAPVFDYVVVFGGKDTTATYGAGATTLYATDYVRILEP